MSDSTSPNNPKKCTISAQLLSGPIIDKFFAVGGLAGCIGGALLGSTLWLMLSGALTVSSTYLKLRELHVFIEFYLFFGLFIAGFLLHMGPRILQTPRRAGPLYLLIVASLLGGCILLSLSSDSESGSRWGRFLLSAPFVLLLLVFLQDLKKTTADVRRLFGPWLVTSLLTFIVAAWLPLTIPQIAIGVVWLAIASITLAAGRTFIIGALSGRRMNNSENTTMFVAFVLSGALLILQAWQAAGIFTVISFVYYIGKTQCIPVAGGSIWRNVQSRNTHAPILNFAFVLAYIWAVVGAINLTIVGEAGVDGTIHLWVLGWISTLVIGISSQMMRALTGAVPISERTIIGLLCLWQVVPLERGLGRAIGAGPTAALLLAVVTWGILLLWSGSLLVAVIRLWNRQRNKSSKLQIYVHSA